MPVISGTGVTVIPGARGRVSRQGAVAVGVATGRGVATATSAAATLATGVIGNNNAITWTAIDGGTPGNAIQVSIVVAGNNTPLSIVTAPNSIVVNSATGAGGAATSTAAQVIAAVAAHAAATQLVTVANNGASSGAGVVVAVAPTNLAGGTDGGANPTSAEFNRLVWAVNNLRVQQSQLITALQAAGVTA